MKRMIMLLVLLCPSLACADAVLYTHCLQGWSAQTVGETCFAWATEQGLPTYGEPEERSAVRAFRFCEIYFRQYLSQSVGVPTAIECHMFAYDGPSLIAGW